MFYGYILSVQKSKSQIFTKVGMNNVIDKLLENARTICALLIELYLEMLQNKSVQLVEHFHIIFKLILKIEKIEKNINY